MNDQHPSLLDRIIRFFLEQKFIVALMLVLLGGWGVMVAPFDWDIDWLPRDPVPVDAIPNLAENQQIVFTEWPGQSPQDVDDQVTYPLTVALMGVPGVQEVRSLSMTGFSSIFLIFDEGTEFYWSRARITEKLGSLPAGVLPPGVEPALGPDATGMGQIFWYTIEGRDPDGNPAGGWDLHELRTVQDWYVRYGLLAAEGVSEVGSIGGFVQEYQIDVDPEAMRAHGVTLRDVFTAVQKSNLDIGARTTEINRVEYLVRGTGFVQGLDDLEQIAVRDGPDFSPIRVRDVATVTLGPAERRGVLTYTGAEAVGAAVVVREGFNPLEAIQNVHARIEEISPGLPAKAVVDWNLVQPREVEDFAYAQGFEATGSAQLNQDAWLDWMRDTDRSEWPAWLTRSQLEIVPFYDRTTLIHETLATLNDALIQQMLITIIVIILLVMHLRAAMSVALMLPMAVLMCFIGMKLAGVDANVAALAGIAIAIGTIVDMGVIVTENILRHLRDAPPEESRLEVVYRGTQEVSSAVLTAIATTVISFLPVFALTGMEGRMFIPLAYTKTFVLLASVFTALTVIPAVAHLVVAGRVEGKTLRRALNVGLLVAGLGVALFAAVMGWAMVSVAGLVLAGVATFQLFAPRLPVWAGGAMPRVVVSLAAAVAIGWLLALVWEPLGPDPGEARNFLFVAIVVGGLLAIFSLFRLAYPYILRALLVVKLLFCLVPLLLIVTGLTIWLGFGTVFGFVPATLDRIGIDADRVRQSDPWSFMYHTFEGLGTQFMPDFDEGSFLWMPTVSYHGSIGEALEVLQYQDLAIASVPEVTEVIGKIGRIDSALDPAPVGMLESIVHYKSEYKTDDAGRRINFKFDRETEEFLRDEDGELIPDPRGRPFRQWRDHIQSPDDIWKELNDAARLPGTTLASPLQPIETRRVMLQTGMRTQMGVKIRAPDLETLAEVAVNMESLMREVPAVNSPTVTAERVVGKPYLNIDIDRERIARYGLNIEDVQDVIGVALGGRMLTMTVEGRERFPVRVRYPRELRNDIEDFQRVYVSGPNGQQVPLAEVADVRYERGPQMIRSEDTFLTAYITFSGETGVAPIQVIEQSQAYLRQAIDDGRLVIPDGVSYHFAGEWQHYHRLMRTLSVIIPVALAIIFLLLYFQFRSVLTGSIVMLAVLVAWSGGFMLMWLYGQQWFLNFEIFDVNMRDLFRVEPVAISAAVWVGFLALFGVAVDDGVVMATYLRQVFQRDRPGSLAEIREATVQAGLRRVRPCLMTSASTILALLPVLTSTGRGADFMIPMAIPILGGMSIVLISMFTVPVMFCLIAETKWRLGMK